MPDNRDDEAGAGRRDRYRAIVQRIADTLRIPVGDLLDAAASDEYPDETSELIRLWFKIKDPAARQAILDQIRKLVGE